MSDTTLREQLHRQIDHLPDTIVQQIANFTNYLLARQQKQATYEEWDENAWRDFVLGQLFRDADEVEYTLDDAQEIYHQ